MKMIDVWSLPEGDKELKSLLNHNPPLNRYTKSQPETGRNPNETDRGGWRGYPRVYSKYLADRKNDSIKILEIGANNGYGLLAWARYFPNATIHSMEVDLKYTRSHNELFTKYPQFERVKIHYQSSTDSYAWVKLDETFDVIIDDGSHLPKDQLYTLRQGWKFLNEGGYYFIEDISYRYFEPSCEIVNVEISLLEKQGYFAEAYYHENKGWANILANKDVWKRYGVTDKTPKIAKDYIAVIHKQKKGTKK